MVGYFEQEIKGENKRTCIEEIWEEFPAFSQYEVRAALARCGLTTKHIESQVRVLSGGEQAKVRNSLCLCCLHVLLCGCLCLTAASADHAGCECQA